MTENKKSNNQGIDINIEESSIIIQEFLPLKRFFTVICRKPVIFGINE